MRPSRTTRRLGAYAALAALPVLACAAGDASAQSPPPPAISLAAPASLTDPAGTQLIATAASDVGPTPFYIRIYDDDSGALVTSCSGGTTCEATVAAPAVRHFHAEVAAAGVPAQSSSVQVSAVVGGLGDGALLGSDLFQRLAARQLDTGSGLLRPALPQRFGPSAER